MKKYVAGLLTVSLLLCGCEQKEHITLNDKYSEYFDTESHKATRGIVYEYGEVPVMDAEEYLSEETSDEFLNNTSVTLHGMKDEEMIEEAIQLEDLLDIGDYYLLITHEDESIQLILSVRDTIPPEFSNFTDKLSYEVGSETVDLATLFTAEDLSETTITVEGNVDYNTVGEYKVKVVAVDEYGNRNEKECTIMITEITKDMESTAGSSSNSGSSGNSKPSTSGSTGSTSGSTSGSNSSSSGSSNTGSSSSSGSTGSGSTGSSGSTTTQPSQPTVTECQHEYSNVGSTGILTDEYPGDLAQAIYESLPGDELYEKYVRSILEKNGGNCAVDVYPVRCEKCKQSLKYTINVY